MLLAAKTEQTFQNDTRNVKIQQKLYQKRDSMPSIENKEIPVETLKKVNLHLNSGTVSVFNKLISNNGLPLYVYRCVLQVKYLCLPQICSIHRTGGVSPTGQCNESQHNPRKVNQSDLIIFHHEKKTKQNWKLGTSNHLECSKKKKKKSFHRNSFLSMFVDE